MDYPVLVAMGVDRGQEFVDHLVQNGIDLTAAFWVQVNDEGRWTMHLATDLIERLGRAEAYRLLLALHKQMPSPKLDLSDISLIDSLDPRVALLLEVQQRYDLHSGTWTGPLRKGSVQINDAYFYPLPQALKTP